MSKDLKINILLDFYGDFLTKKQKDVALAYYNEDFSLAEIATNFGVTRQSIHDCLKKSQIQLLEMENKLKLVSKFEFITKQINFIKEELNKMKNDSDTQNALYNEKIKNINLELDKILDLGV